MYTIDIDVGGTFTDGFFTDGEVFRTAKVFTTPHDLTECVLACVEAGAAAYDRAEHDFLRLADVVRISTTAGTNLIVQRRGPKIGVIVSAGSEQTLYGNGAASAIGNFVAAEMVAGVREAVDADGRVVTEVDETETLAAVRELLARGARLIVVGFANSWLNPHNEQRVRDYVRSRYPSHYLRSVPLQLSTEIVHVAGDHARTNSALLNAYVHVDIANAFYRIEDHLRERGFRHPMLVVHASGGNARVAKTVALHTLNSGPAVAAHGAATVARLLGLPGIVTGDMGGTSFDIAVIQDGIVPQTLAPTIAGVEIATPMVDVETIGAGGGSIARARAGRVTVGPDSTGAVPGPACYDRGGLDPTVTDANLLLGFIDPAAFLGGRFTLAPERAEDAIRTRLAQPLGISTTAAALAIRTVVADLVAAALDARLAPAGGEVANFSFLSIGGATPLHAVDIAERLGFKEIIAFPFGSVFSAFGGSTTSIRHVYSRATSRREAGDTVALDAIASELEALAREDMRGEGVASGSVVLERFQERSGSGPVTSVRVVSTAPVIHYTPTRRPAVSGSPQPRSSRDVRWSSADPIPTPIFDRDDLFPGHHLKGPAIVEGPDTLYPINPAWCLDVDSYGFYRITRSS